MPVDVESELARLGAAWTASVDHVDVAEVLERAITESRDVTTISLEPSRPQSVTRRHSRRVTRVVLALAVAAAVVTTLIVISRDHTTAPADTTTSSGWVAFAAGDDAGEESTDTDIYLVRKGSPAHRIAGSDADAIVQKCAAFSPDGTRLAYGQATGAEEGRYRDAGLVIVDLTADGDVSATTTIALDDMDRPPCAIWSPDGRWIAFGAGTFTKGMHPPFADEVWMVDTQTDEIRRLPDDVGPPSGLMVSDFEWAPDATELYIAQRSGGIWVYSVATNQTRELLGSSWRGVHCSRAGRHAHRRPGPRGRARSRSTLGGVDRSQTHGR
jgi:hypothetical protein